MYDTILAKSPFIIYQPGGVTAGLVVTTWAEVQAFIAYRQGTVIVYVDDSIVSPALVPGATGITDCEGRVELRPFAADSLLFSVLQIEDGAQLLNLYKVSALDLRSNCRGVLPSLDWNLTATGGGFYLEEFAQLSNAATATNPMIVVAAGKEVFIDAVQASFVMNAPGVPLFNVAALTSTLGMIALDAAFPANLVSGPGTFSVGYDNVTASGFTPAGTVPAQAGVGTYAHTNLDSIWETKPLDPVTMGAPNVNDVPHFDGTKWVAGLVPSSSVSGTPNTGAYFNAAGALTGTPTFITAIDATGFFLIGATTSDNGSSARVQNSNIIANASQFRSNQYGNNAGVPGLSTFKSRGATIGTLTGLLAGDPIMRITSVGVAPDNASIPLSSFITVQVPANFVPVAQNWLPSELEVQLVPLAGPINSRRVVFKVTSEGETQTLRGIRAGGPSTLPANLTTGTLWSSDAVTPNGTIVGSPGDLFSDTTGGAGATLWVKETGVATNTGWVSVVSSSTLTQQTIAASGAFVPASVDVLVFVDTTGGAVNLTLPAPALGVATRYTFKDSKQNFNVNALTLVPPGAVLIEGVNANYVISAQGAQVTVISDGVNYFV